MRSRMAPALIAVAVLAVGGTASAQTIPNPVRTLDGSGNNAANPTWGQAGTNYTRNAGVNYADGVGRVQPGPDERYLSNRIFNDIGQNVFSEDAVSQWGWVWGQFMDHDFGLRDETPGDGPALPFNAHDPLEDFRNDFGAIDFSRTRPAPGTGVGRTPRAHVNTISSYIDGSNVFGVNNSRLDWLRDGPADGNPANNDATLMLPGGYLPKATARGNVGAAPPMDLMGPLTGQPAKAVVAGDVRANENIALTATHTLFAREHNRIVRALPRGLPDELKFQIARRVVGAESQFITYEQFLPALGVDLAPYRGYRPNVNAALSEEFAVAGYRAHSMIHGEFEPTVANTRYTDAQKAFLARNGVQFEDNGDGTTTLVIPLSAAFGNPDLLQTVGEREVLESLGESQYKNDEQFDNSLRSVLFQVPKPGVDPATCGAPVINPDCFVGVQDLGALDVARQRDHGIPYYNDLRRAYGLAPRSSFTAITGESTDRLPRGLSIDDPRILRFVSLRDAAGNSIDPQGEDHNEGAVQAVRRTTLAARLRAVYGDVNNVDAFTGMVSERHAAGSEMGELQRAIWKRQFEAIRDGDRFFYRNDLLVLNAIRDAFGIDFRRQLSQIIRDNVPGTQVEDNVFEAA
jgi:peroxidase